MNVHFDSVFLDGVYGARGIIRLLKRRSLLSDHGDDAADPLQDEEPLLAACAAASLQHRIATGDRTGKPVMRLGDRIEAEDVEFSPGRSCANVQGFSLHAGVAINAHDRARLERLAR